MTNTIDDLELYRLVGNRVREIRTKFNLNQSQLGERLGLNRTSITNIEQGTQKLPLHVLYRFCLEFNLSLDDVLPDLLAVAMIYQMSQIKF